MVGQQERRYEEIGSSMGMPHTQLVVNLTETLWCIVFIFWGGDGGGGMAYLPKQPNNVLVVLLMEEILYHLLF